MPDQFHDFCDLQNIYRNNIVASTGLNPGPARRSVGPDLGLNCLDKIAASTASHCQIYSITFLVVSPLMRFQCIRKCVTVVHNMNMINNIYLHNGNNMICH